MIHKIIEEYADQQKEGSRFLRCPRCGLASMDHNLHRNAKSRRADIYICRGCGYDESFEDLLLRRPPNEKDNESYLLSWWIAEQKLEPVKCSECVFLMVSDCYAQCSKGYKGTFAANASDKVGCVRGKRKGERR